MINRVEFYQEHLNRVSRSFAFCIERLSAPLRAQVSLAYLICRILDSVEDADWENKGEQLRQFESFERYLVQSFTDDEITAWVSRFPGGLPEGEKLLLPETGSILRDFQALDEAARDAIQEPVLSMSRGMRHFASKRERGQVRLVSLTEVNQYCFFVAGVVGEILTRLVSLAKNEREIEERSLADAFHFGLFLQKVNLLKDQLQDESSGRFLVPSRAEVMGSLREHAFRAIEYVTHVPEKFLSYRLFCSWSLLLGVASLPFIENSWKQRTLIKIPRVQTQLLLAQIEKVVGDNKNLRALFDLIFSAGPAFTAPQERKIVQEETGFPALYQGLLSISDQKVFGVV